MRPAIATGGRVGSLAMIWFRGAREGRQPGGANAEVPSCAVREDELRGKCRSRSPALMRVGLSSRCGRRRVGYGRAALFLFNRYGSCSAAPAKRLRRVSSINPARVEGSADVRCEAWAWGKSRAVGALLATMHCSSTPTPAAYITILLQPRSKPDGRSSPFPCTSAVPVTHSLALGATVRGHPGPSRSLWPLTSRDTIVSGLWLCSSFPSTGLDLSENMH
ncbi:hypothetical protein PSPO01_05453 [Paraphaeosphaeria sporulosa]